MYFNGQTFTRDRLCPLQSGLGYLLDPAKFTSLRIQSPTALRSLGKCLCLILVSCTNPLTSQWGGETVLGNGHAVIDFLCISVLCLCDNTLIIIMLIVLREAQQCTQCSAPRELQRPGQQWGGDRDWEGIQQHSPPLIPGQEIHVDRDSLMRFLFRILATPR